MNHSTDYTMAFSAPPPPDDAPLLNWALWYAAQGWPVFPCHGKQPITRRGFLDATRDDAQIHSWWAQWPEANIGIPIPPGQVVLDVDPRHAGDTTLHALQQQYGPLPDTLTSHTGGGGLHLFFVASRPVKNKAHIGEGIDVQAQGAYIIAPPSIHPDTARRYVWDAAYGPDALTPQALPTWLETLLAFPIPPAPGASHDPQAPILAGRRETTLMHIAGAMQRVGASPEAIRSALDAENQRCVPPLDVADLDRLTWSVGRYAPAPRLEVGPRQTADATEAPSQSTTPESLPLSDVFNAHALVERHGQDLRYCRPWKSWFRWTGTHWQRDDLGTVILWAHQTLLALLDTLKDIPDAKARDALYRHIKSSLASSRIDGLLKQAQPLPGIPVLPEAFDQHHWLVNCANGTLNLRDGTLQPHHRDDLLTRCLPLPYDPDATCPIWERFVWHIMGGSLEQDDPEESAAVHHARFAADERARRLIGFLQRAVGYSLTGDTSEHCFFLLYGTGRNGKGTFIETVQALLGPYGKTAEMSTFLARQTETVRNDLADLHGARFVSASEADKGRRLAESLVKRLTGGDRIKARFLFQEYFEFLPQMHVWLAVNDKPIIRGTDLAMWERIRLIPFEVFLKPEERDKHLGEKLRAELPGILTWAVKGCLEWQRYDGLKEPAEVTHATEAYRKEMDTLAQFLDDCCLQQPALSVKVGALYKAYETWCTDNGHQAESLTAIGYRLDAMGYPKEPERRRTGWWRTGLGLLAPPTDGRDV